MNKNCNNIKHTRIIIIQAVASRFEKSRVTLRQRSPTMYYLNYELRQQFHLRYINFTHHPVGLLLAIIDKA